MTQRFTREEISRRTDKDNVAIIIDNAVYGVAGFLDDHPGGLEVLLANAGRDASQCFLDIGHSEEAKLLRTKFKIGEVVEEDRWEVAQRKALPALGTESVGAGAGVGALADVWGPPLLVGMVATLIYWYLFM